MSKYNATDFNRGRVAAMAAAGMQEERIAKHIGCSPKTLRRHFRPELDNALTNRVTDIADNLTQIALSPRKTMAQVVASIFLLKCLGKVKEVHTVEHVGEDGKPLPPAQTLQIILPHNNRGTELAAKFGLLRVAPPLLEALPVERK
jgi:hypothetical protein